MEILKYVPNKNDYITVNGFYTGALKNLSLKLFHNYYFFLFLHNSMYSFIDLIPSVEIYNAHSHGNKMKKC